MPLLEKRARPTPAIHAPRHGGHRRLVPLHRARLTPFQERRHHIVPVLENVGLDRQTLAHTAFHGISPAVDQRGDIFDDDGWRSWRHGADVGTRATTTARWEKVGARASAIVGPSIAP